MGKSPKVPIVIATVVGSIAIILCIALQPTFQYVLKVMVKKMVPLSSSSSTLSTWEDPMSLVDAYLKFYFFDVVNWENVTMGAKPELVQRGPYVYNEYKVKKEVKFEDSDSISYREIRYMVFNPTLSVGSENDTFNTINVPLISVITMLESQPIGEAVLDLVLKYVMSKQEPVFKTLSVYQFLWGYKDTLLSDISAIVTALNMSLPIPPGGYFGIFYQKNNTDDGVYVVNSGQTDLNQFLGIKSWNNEKLLPYWKTSYCNMLNGTDGTMYPPFVTKDEVLAVFSSDICRSLNLIYSQDVTLDDLTLYRFKPPASLFAYPPENMDSECYCVGSQCPHAGVLNISACQLGAPVFVSQPHFLNGPYYEQLVSGLTPNDDEHNTFIDVQPTLGVVLQGAKRLQMNLVVDSNKYIKETQHLPSLLLPLLWLEESAKINSNGLNQLNDQFFSYQKVVNFLFWVLLVLGVVLIIGAVAYGLRKRYQKKEDLQATEKTALISSSSASSESGNSSDV